MDAAVLTSLLAAALTALCTVPQVNRALRTTRGLSSAAWLQAFVLGSIWAAYGLATGSWVLLVSEGLFALGSLAIVLRILPGWQVIAWTLGCTVLVGTAFTTVGPGPCLLAAAFASVAIRLVQMDAVVRGGSAAGVSLPTWLLLASSNFAWAATGVLHSDAFFAWSAAVGGAFSLAVVVVCLAVARADGQRQRAAAGR